MSEISLVVVVVPPAFSVVVPVTFHAPPCEIVLDVPPPVAIERSPARVSTPNVMLPASLSPPPSVTIKFWAVIAPAPETSASPSWATPVAAAESRIKVRLLVASKVIAALIAISSPASSVRSFAAPPEASTASVTVISS